MTPSSALTSTRSVDALYSWHAVRLDSPPADPAAAADAAERSRCRGAGGGGGAWRMRARGRARARKRVAARKTRAPAHLAPRTCRVTNWPGARACKKPRNCATTRATSASCAA
jgi:hypothetical protein